MRKRRRADGRESSLGPTYNGMMSMAVPLGLAALFFALFIATADAGTPERRKLVPASHPAMDYHSRFVHYGPKTAWDDMPTWLAGDGSKVIQPVAPAFNKTYSARCYWVNSVVSLSFTGTSKLTVHRGTLLRSYFYKIDEPSSSGIWKWNLATGYDFVLSKTLNPNKVYTLTILFDFYGFEKEGVTFYGIGLDFVPAAQPVMPVDAGIRPQRTIEFIGDSLTGLKYLNGDSLWRIGSYAQETCNLLGTRCSTVARAGMELIDYPPPILSQYTTGPAGMEYSFFRMWGPVSFETRDVPLWDFAKQGFTPSAVLINLGTNDRYNRFKDEGLLLEHMTASMTTLVKGIRRVYGKDTLIVVMVPIGKRFAATRNKAWEIRPLYPVSTYQDAVNAANEKNTILMDTTGWVNRDNAGWVMYDSTHPSAKGNMYLASKIAAFLREKMGGNIGPLPFTTKSKARTRTRTRTSTPTSRPTTTVKPTTSTNTALAIQASVVASTSAV